MLYRELLVPRRAAITASSSDGGVIEVPTPGRTLLVLFVLFSVAWPSIQTYCLGVSAEEEAALDEMPTSQEPVRLELCLCHPETEELTKPYLSFKWRSTAASSPYAATSRGKRR